jgi:hypothetical protein
MYMYIDIYMYAFIYIYIHRFQEIQDVRDVDEVVLTMEGGPYQEYFYIQIPVGMHYI